MENLVEYFQLPFVQRGFLEVLFLSVGAGILGTWVVLRGLAFFAHAVGMSTFPGLVLADGLGFAAPLGALASAGIFATSLERLSRRRKSGYDSLTALLLVGMLALGAILASDVFASGANVDTLLFGSLLAISDADVAFAGAVSLIVVAASILFGRTWLATGFDASAVRSLGVRSAIPDGILLVLIALFTTATLSAVGSLLATTLFVVPAATVRLFTARLVPWQLLTISLVAAEGTAGLLLSLATNAPPGATIAMLAGGVFALAFVVTELTTRLRTAPQR
ncbi:metal ABC transporter permease [Rubrobacter indicoceani]|uniref:metal ABC transporter permease n=1 Tax=Rubrobacter indicoceani TaxID=2051957 RepID=UPI000E5B9CAF|nr:metal ABC transporter permease [Rubrobacter indicoceani]